jgi:hypothetical protein
MTGSLHPNSQEAKQEANETSKEEKQFWRWQLQQRTPLQY